MIIKHGDGKIVSIIKSKDELTEELKEAVKAAQDKATQDKIDKDKKDN